MRAIATILFFLPVMLCAQLSVVPNLAVGKLNDNNVIIPGANLRYEIGDDDIFIRFQTGWRGFFDASEGSRQHQLQFGTGLGLKYLDFAYLVGGFAYHLDKQSYNKEAKQSWHDQWVWEFEYWAGAEFRAGPIEIMPYVSAGVDGNFTAALRVATTISL